MLFCMVYTVFGLALMMLFLANIGTFMARTLKTVYSRLACRWCRVRRRWTELPEGADYEPDKIKTDIVGPEVRASKVISFTSSYFLGLHAHR